MYFCYVCKNKDPTSSYHQFPKDKELRAKWLKLCNFEEDDVMKYTKICSLHFDDSCYIIKHDNSRMMRKGSIPSLNLPKKKNRKSNSRNANVLSLNSQPSTSGANISTEIMLSVKSQEQLSAPSTNVPIANNPVLSDEHQQPSTSGLNIVELVDIVNIVESGAVVDNDTIKIEENDDDFTEDASNTPPSSLKYDFSSPRRAERHFNNASKTISSLRRKVDLLEERNARLTHELDLLNNELKRLQKNKQLPSTASKSILIRI